MSRVYFHSPSGEAELWGGERAVGCKPVSHLLGFWLPGVLTGLGLGFLAAYFLRF